LPKDAFESAIEIHWNQYGNRLAGSRQADIIEAKLKPYEAVKNLREFLQLLDAETQLLRITDKVSLVIDKACYDPYPRHPGLSGKVLDNRQ
jgi:hypothetical protein